MIRPGIPEYFRLRPRGGRLAREVEEEIAFHVEQRAQSLINRGVPPAAALAEAARRFGEMEHARLILQRSATRREYRMSVSETLKDWRDDFAYAVRSLGRDPLVALVIILTLALGIGANAMMFGIIDQLLLRGPAHVIVPEQVHRIYFTQKNFNGRNTSPSAGYVGYTTLRDNTRSFDGVAAYSHKGKLRLGIGRDAKEIPVATATSKMFEVLGVKPRYGRFYTAEEDRPPQGSLVAVISEEFWRSEFGPSPDVIGRTLTLNEKDYSVVGVAPEGFTGTEMIPASVWLPMSSFSQPTDEWATSWCCTWLAIVARLKPGVTPEAASQDATLAFRAAAAAADVKRYAETELTVRPIRFANDGREPGEASVARWLLGVAGIVLLVACANVVNLLLARSVRRRREIAVRLAVGISRARLMRLLLSEALVLAVAGGAAALAIAWWGGRFIRGTLLPDVQWDSPLGMRVLVFSAAVSILVGIVVGIVPALQSTRQDLTDTLKATSKAAGGGRRSLLRDGLTVAQAALSVVLLVGAGLFVRSLMNVGRLDLGVDADRVLSVSAYLAPLPSTGDDKADWKARTAQDDAFSAAAIERLSARGDVEAVALALGAPLSGSFGVDVTIPGVDSLPRLDGGGPFITAGSPDYFRTVGTSIIRGRGFLPGEGAGTAPVTVVNETMANTLWPGGDPLTKCLIINNEDGVCTPVVGVAEDVHRTGLRELPSMQYYVPYGQEKNISGSDLLVRPRGDIASFTQTLESELYAVAPGARRFVISELSERLDPEKRPWRLGATLFLAFGALALLISAIGLFSVIAYGVAQRRTELGIRLALGAQARGLMTLILRQGVTLAVAGIVLGIIIALAGGRFIEPLLFDTPARDPLTMAGVAAVLLATTIVACLIPALRARRIDPIEAMRAE
jgi:predicted permease